MSDIGNAEMEVRVDELESGDKKIRLFGVKDRKIYDPRHGEYYYDWTEDPRKAYFRATNSRPRGDIVMLEVTPDQMQQFGARIVEGEGNGRRIFEMHRSIPDEMKGLLTKINPSQERLIRDAKSMDEVNKIFEKKKVT